MLINERVNDYDLYFKDPEVVIDLIKYYYKQETKEDLEVYKGEWKKIADFKELIKRYREGEDLTADKIVFDEKEERIFLYIKSVGLLEGQQEEDEYSGEEHQQEEQQETNKYKVKFISSNAISLTNGIQLITRFYGTPEEIHKNFDFIHATASYDYHEDKLIIPAEAMRSLLQKKLFYRGSRYPICSLFRIRKFMKRGWNIGAGEILKIVFQIKDLDLNDKFVLYDQLTGVDYMYMLQLVYAIERALEQKDENGEYKHDTLESKYVIEIIERVFNDD